METSPEIYPMTSHPSSMPREASVSPQPVAGPLPPSTDISTAPVTTTTVTEPSEGLRPRRAHRPRPGFDLEDIKVCTGCGKNAKGDTNVVKCRNVHCSTEWVRKYSLTVY